MNGKRIGRGKTNERFLWKEAKPLGYEDQASTAAIEYNGKVHHGTSSAARRQEKLSFAKLLEHLLSDLLAMACPIPYPLQSGNRCTVSSLLFGVGHPSVTMGSMRSSDVALLSKHASFTTQAPLPRVRTTFCS